MNTNAIDTVISAQVRQSFRALVVLELKALFEKL